jgi:hypothetical protein
MQPRIAMVRMNVTNSINFVDSENQVTVSALTGNPHFWLVQP